MLVFVALPPASAAPLRIMPLGDSITAGYTDNPPSGGTGGWTVPFEFGYRKQLYQLLHNAAYDFVFVGASPEPWVSNYGDPTHGGTVSPTFDLRPIGQDGHRGYGGYRIPPITNAVAGFINTDNPDIILLLLGINGIDSGSPAEMDLLVETIFNAKPAVKLIIAQITPKSSSYTTDNASIRSFNAYIAATLVPKYLGQGRSISMVNQYVNFLTNPGDLTSINNSLFSNGINHPTNAVYDIMAGTWFSGIQAITPPASPLLSATQFTSSITAGGTIGSFSHTPSPSSDTYIYSLVSGAGATDNAKFNISGNLLLAGSYPFSSDPNGSMYAIRVRATGVSSGQVGEQTFTLTAISDSDGDLIPDAWEIAKAGNLTSLTAVGDFDSDGLTDRAEYNLSMGAYANIDPTNADSDSDGLLDGEEINGAGQRPPTNPTLADTDGDSVSDFNEDNTGTFVSILKTGTNPTIQIGRAHV